MGPERYIEIDRCARAGIAWLQTGGWMWRARKGEKNRRCCPLCQQRVGVEHIILECRELREGRVRRLNDLNITKSSLYHTFRMKELGILKKLGLFSSYGPYYHFCYSNHNHPCRAPNYSQICPRI